MIYIKRIVKQDLTREIAIPGGISSEFFKYDATTNSTPQRIINLEYCKSDAFSSLGATISLNIHMPRNGRSGEARFSSPLKNFLLAHSVAVNDILVFISKEGNINDYSFYCVPFADVKYPAYDDILLNNDENTKNHKLITSGPTSLPGFFELTNERLQVIYFGAPGTGKSYTLDNETKGCDVIRTTFHPDSDYSSFVGVYKPVEVTRSKTQVVWDFASKSAIELPVLKTDINGKTVTAEETAITYKFIRQAFIQAYIKAWIKKCTPEKHISDILKQAPKGIGLDDEFDAPIDLLGLYHRYNATIDLFKGNIKSDIKLLVAVYIHEYFHHFFRLVSEHIEEIEEAIVECATLCFLELLEQQDSTFAGCLQHYYDIVSNKKNLLPYYAFGAYLYDHKEFDWIWLYHNAKIDSNAPLVKEYIKVFSSYPYGKEDEVMNLLYKILSPSKEICTIANPYSIQGGNSSSFTYVKDGADLSDEEINTLKKVGEYKLRFSKNSEVFFRTQEAQQVVVKDKPNDEEKKLKKPIKTTKRKLLELPHSDERQYLIIEEINRGNCAQIFGDLFQSLDRDDYGFSKYPIQPDADIQNELQDAFKDIYIQSLVNDVFKESIKWLDNNSVEHEETASEAIGNGHIIVLPNNLFLRATMNTSDQSLFPMDSAFKRRWDWRYFAIKDGQKGYKVDVDGATYDWWETIQRLNEKILAVTNSADKQMGYFFVKPKEDGIISAETFVSKVIFYLWNDVFKDYNLDDENNPFTENTRFEKFWDENGKVKVDVLKEFLDALKDKNESTDATTPAPAPAPASAPTTAPTTTGEPEPAEGTSTPDVEDTTE